MVKMELKYKKEIMKQQYINKIREACIKAKFPDAPTGIVELYVEKGGDVQLSDVLLAIAEMPILIGEITKHQYTLLEYWNLKETLENQELPTLQFIADLL